MPDAQLQWIDQCGHVPHLEQPEVTAQYISEFLRSEKLRPLQSTTAASINILDGPWGAIGLGGVAAVTAAGALIGGGF